MSKIEAVLITINTLTRIPFVNLVGPILSPISVTRGVAENLQKMGFPVKFHDTRVVTDTALHTILDEVSTTDVADSIEISEDSIETNPNSTPNLLTSQEPIEVTTEETIEPKSEEVTTEVEETVADEVVETEVEETVETELEVFTIGHYKSWTIKKLVTYLQSASDYLEEAEVESLETLSKTKLLDLIEKRLISAAE